MLNKTKILLLTPVFMICAFAAVFMAGYLGDLICTAEQSGRGECGRLSDGQNNMLMYGSGAFYVLTFACSVGSISSIVTNVVCRCTYEYGRGRNDIRWANRVAFGESEGEAKERVAKINSIKRQRDRDNGMY